MKGGWQGDGCRASKLGADEEPRLRYSKETRASIEKGLDVGRELQRGGAPNQCARAEQTEQKAAVTEEKRAEIEGHERARCGALGWREFGEMQGEAALWWRLGNLPAERVR